jgi:hypothetical protein
MHARQAALIGALLVLMLLVASPTRAEKDAAIKAQEGDINHWIEYYRKNQQQPPVAPAPQAVKGKEASEKVKSKR